MKKARTDEHWSPTEWNHFGAPTWMTFQLHQEYSPGPYGVFGDISIQQNKQTNKQNKQTTFLP
jgi:hypothetical protein